MSVCLFFFSIFLFLSVSSLAHNGPKRFVLTVQRRILTILREAKHKTHERKCRESEKKRNTQKSVSNFQKSTSISRNCGLRYSCCCWCFDLSCVCILVAVVVVFIVIVIVCCRRRCARSDSNVWYIISFFLLLQGPSYFELVYFFQHFSQPTNNTCSALHWQTIA